MKIKRNKISIVGLGFVGSAMAVAINSIRNKKKNLYNVLGIEKDDLKGKNISLSLNNGIFPFKVNDKLLINKAKLLKDRANFYASNNIEDIQDSKIIICSINFDIKKKNKKFITNSDKYLNAMDEIAKYINPNATLIVESTLPPGYCENKIIPRFNKIFRKRKIDIDKVKIAYSFERVMPGKNYFNSIKNIWRVYAANNKVAENDCKNFFESIINIKKYPLTKMNNIRSVELTKVLENTYRTVNIAFIDEWTKISEKFQINLNEVIDAIKLRPTHSNIMRPGLGVGGYCLTKDSLLGMYSSKKIYNFKNSQFPFANLALKVNNSMPNHTVKVVKMLNNNNLKNKKILICGASYKNDIGDTRYSPSEILYKKLKKLGCNIEIYDPYVKLWSELNLKVSQKIKNFNNFDNIIFAVNHNEFANINFSKLNKKRIIVDACGILSSKQKSTLNKRDAVVYKIGQGI